MKVRALSTGLIGITSPGTEGVWRRRLGAQIISLARSEFRHGNASDRVVRIASLCSLSVKMSVVESQNQEVSNQVSQSGSNQLSAIKYHSHFSSSPALALLTLTPAA